MKEVKKPQGTCPQCKRTCSITKAGVINGHRDTLSRCVGAGQKPLAAPTDEHAVAKDVPETVEIEIHHTNHTEWDALQKPSQPFTLVDAVRTHGGEVTDLSAAIRIACLALEHGVPYGSWNKATVQQFARKLGSTHAAKVEGLAIAADKVICERMGVITLPVEEQCRALCESSDSLVYNRILTYATVALAGNEADRAADRILNLLSK